MVSVLGRNGAGLDFEFLQCLWEGQRQTEASSTDRCVVAPSSMNSRRSPARPRRKWNPWRELRSVVSVPAADRRSRKEDQFGRLASVERHLQDAHVIDHLTNTGAAGFNQGGVRLNLDLIGNLAHLQDRIDHGLALTWSTIPVCT